MLPMPAGRGCHTTTMQTDFIYDCTPRFLHSCSLRASRFTGKERDTESGLDYFGARYYGSNAGRFMSSDPSKLSVLFTNPQTWNRYSYVYNNPLGLKDDNGKWPTDIHNDLIDRAFPNLTPAQRQILKDVSKQQDSVLDGGQSNELAFEHAMRAPGQSVADAEMKYNDFVDGSEEKAFQIQYYGSDNDTKLNPAALAEFAKALHAVLDSTSPSHAGFQVWDWSNFALVRRHIKGEKTINDQQRASAIQAAQNAFNKTFGYLGFMPDNATVTTTQGGGTTCGGTQNPCK
jgi:RHS repeat-associated protein